MTSNSSDNNFLQVGSPQTPRSTGNTVNRLGITPTFSFGLGFSPSFQFNSPRNINILNMLSPRRFLQTSNNLTKAINNKTTENEGDKTEQSKDVFDSMTPPDSSKSGNSKFLDSMTLSVHKKENNDISKDSSSSQDDSMDIWSSMGNESNHESVGNLTSIYEEEDKENSAIFLTPKKLLLVTTHANDKLGSAPKLLPIKPKIDAVSDSASKEADFLVSRPKKKRKLAPSPSNDPTCSPNNSIASQIDLTVESPSNRKKSLSSETSENSNEKVWCPELDDILVKSYIKYRNFRNNQSLGSSVLKNTSQNKVLSRMLLNKTGILRTAKQISSRLFRLTKLKKLTKSKIKVEKNDEEREDEVSPSINSEISEFTQTMLEDLISNNQLDSISTNEIIDKELEIILSSPPLDEEVLNSSTVIEEKSSIRKTSSYKLLPRDFQISYSHNQDPNESHVFTIFDALETISLNETSLRKKLNNPMNKALSQALFEKLKHQCVPIWLIAHSMKLKVEINTSTPISPFTTVPKAYDILKGSFESFLQVDVISSSIAHKSMLGWNCLTKVYNRSNLIFETTEAINGYFIGNKFELQIPFLKQFWSGYLAFLCNGTRENSIYDISIIQIFYDNEHKNENEFNEANSNIYGYIIHDFNNATARDKGASRFQMINLVDNEDEDDNETVLADSSPYKNIISPNKNQIEHSPTRKRLTIDVSKANNLNIEHGPLSAPIYNANIVQKFNQEMLKQQQQLREIQNNQQQKILPNENSTHHPHQPNLNHLQSTDNISQCRISSPTKSKPCRPKPEPSAFMDRTHSLPQAGSTISHTGKNVSSASVSIPPQQPQIQCTNPVIPSVQQQFMVNLGNGYVPLISLHPKIQEQFMSMHCQPELQRQQQELYLQGLKKQCFPSENQQFHLVNNSYSAPASQTHFSNKPFNRPPQTINMQTNNNAKQTIKDNTRSKGIKFGPILEYDPSKDTNYLHTNKSAKPAKTGIHRFPMNTQVMYKPKKK